MVGIFAIMRCERDLALARIVDVGRVVIEGRERADGADHDRHRVGVAAVAGEEARHLLVHHRVVRDGAAEVDELGVGRQLPVQEQVAHCEEARVVGQLVDRVAAIEQFALVAVDEGDLALAVCRRGEARIVGETAGLTVQLGDIDDFGADRAARMSMSMVLPSTVMVAFFAIGLSYAFMDRAPGTAAMVSGGLHHRRPLRGRYCTATGWRWLDRRSCRAVSTSRGITSPLSHILQCGKIALRRIPANDVSPRSQLCARVPLVCPVRP